MADPDEEELAHGDQPDPAAYFRERAANGKQAAERVSDAIRAVNAAGADLDAIGARYTDGRTLSVTDVAYRSELLARIEVDRLRCASAHHAEQGSHRAKIEEETVRTERIKTMPAPALPRRRFYEAVDGTVRHHVVAADMPKALALLSDLDLGDCEYLMINELPESSARGVRIRPGDDSPADNLADAPMGAVYSTEV